MDKLNKNKHIEDVLFDADPLWVVGPVEIDGFVKDKNNFDDDDSGWMCEGCESDCCSSYQHIFLTQEDLKRIAQGRGFHVVEFTERYVTLDNSMSGYVGYLKRQMTEGQRACCFLYRRPDGKGRGCSIYEWRPDICRNYSAEGCEMRRVKSLAKRNFIRDFFKGTGQ
jgi:Fe-S-cluster containining protein